MHGNGECYCCTASDAATNYEVVPGLIMYEVDLKGYQELVLCLDEPTLSTTSAYSMYHCSSRCDDDATCAAFTYIDDICIKRTQSNVDEGEGRRLTCYVSIHRVLTVGSE